MAPGRELASQIFSVCEKLIQGTGLRSTMVIGGANALRQVERFKKVKPQVRMESRDWLNGNTCLFFQMGLLFLQLSLPRQGSSCKCL